MENISTIEISRISVNPNNPRARIEDVSDLVSSIKASGLLQPITVRWTKKLDADGMPTGYEVIAGSRRLTACQILKMEKVPCIVRQADDAEAFKLATLENIVRENMTAVDEANAVAKLYEQGHSRQEIAAIFGKSVRWAEGRRNIVKLGEKAMEALAAGTINLGHAEVLTLCAPERVERFLDAAKWHTPGELKNIILSERKRLDKAPFNVSKTCKNCENRSDCQQELFSDVTDSYCLNEDCYKQHIAEEVERIRNNFEKQGWKPVREEDVDNCRSMWNYDYINATTNDASDQEKIKKWKAAGVKPRYWINSATAENGLVFWRQDYNSLASEEETDVNTSQDARDYQLENEIRSVANKMESEELNKFFSTIFGNLDRDQVAILLDLYSDVTYDYTETTAEGDERDVEDSPLLHCGEMITYDDGFQETPFSRLVETLVKDAVGWNGVDDQKRAFYMLEPRETIEDRAKEKILEERKRLEEEAEKATQGE